MTLSKHDKKPSKRYSRDILGIFVGDEEKMGKIKGQIKELRYKLKKEQFEDAGAFHTAGHFQDFRWNVFVEVPSTLQMHSRARREDSSRFAIMNFVNNEIIQGVS